MTPAQADTRFPVGASLVPAALSRDPYPVFRRLQAEEPVSWVPALGMWYVTRHEDCRRVLLDDDAFTTVSPHSLIQATFGQQVLSSDGSLHSRYKSAVRKGFLPGALRSTVEPRIEVLARALVDEFAGQGACELRASFASRLPVQTMLVLVGLPLSEEPRLRAWYDRFERALANFERDDGVARAATAAVAEFHAFLADYMHAFAAQPGEGLLSLLVNAPAGQRLEDDEIRRNVSIIFFGGISTVEALMLNTLYALDLHPEARARVVADPALLPAAIDETMRWLSPVQSATRHVTREVELHGVRLQPGDTVNCMLAAANRDPRVFAAPERFDIDRPEAGQHLGFAVGPHHCLGFHLARAEARIALEVICSRLADWRIEPAARCAPEGYEFRQPARLPLCWTVE